MKSVIALGLSLCFGIGAAQAAMVARTIDYDVGGKKMQSVLVYDDSTRAARPGLVMTPDWKGMNDDQVALAKQLAGKDYVILVADVYGVDVRPKNADEAGTAAKAMLTNRTELRARINAALAQLKAQAGKAPLDGKHWGAFGFCFGGTTSLDLARSGADIQGTVSFHGGLATDDPALAKNIKGKVLALNGGDDKSITADAITAFEKEMRDANVDWQFVNFGGTVHCFAIPTAHGGDGANCNYNERSARRGHVMMHNFFDEVFGGG
ncbi:MAG TPA: dienelactone hydrolase family protein [Rudaea sp.]|nr:dienelactone hydrolase family protein [Rudaea sp.]